MLGKFNFYQYEATSWDALAGAAVSNHPVKTSPTPPHCLPKAEWLNIPGFVLTYICSVRLAELS